MLMEITLENLEIEKGLLSKSLLIPGRGRILKVMVEFTDGIDTGVSLRIDTKEGEEILNVKSDKIKEIYYPRSNIITQRYNNSSFVYENHDSLDYFYFSGGLVFSFDKDNIDSEMILIKKVTLLYDDLQ